MLTSIHLHDFLGLREAELTLSPLNVFCGPNGSGKSSIADAILHCLTGHEVRGLTLPQMVRQGAPSFAVGVTLKNGLRFGRRRARSGGGTCLVESEDAGAAEYEAAVERELGASIAAIAAGLRAGEILSLDAAALQGLLVQLTGAAFGAEAIRRAVGEEIAAVADAAGLQLPTTLEGFGTCAAAAEEARKRFKRDLAKLQQDLARAPAPSPDVAAKLDALPAPRAEFLEKILRDLRLRRDAALRSQDAVKAYTQGGHDQKRKAAQERLAELATVPAITAPDTAKLEADARASRAKVAELTSRIASLEKSLADARAQAAGSKEIPDGIAAAEERLSTVRQNAADFQRAVDIATAEGKKRKALLVKVQAITKGAAGEHPTCESCGQRVAPELVAHLEQMVEQARDGFVEYRGKLDLEIAEQKKLEALLDAGIAARNRIAAEKDAGGLAEKLTAAREQLATVTTDLAAIEAALSGTAEGRRAFDAWSRAQNEFRQVQAELQRLDAMPAPTAPTEDAQELTAGIARGEALLGAAHAVATRAALEAQIAATTEAVRDADMVAKALGPEGFRSDLVAQGVRPFVDAANAALQQLLPGYAVEIDPLHFGFRVRCGDVVVGPEALSDGQRTLVTYVLQLAVVRLAGLKLLILDRGELVDEQGRDAVKRLVGACLGEGIQIVMFTCRTGTPGPGFALFGVDAGTVRQLGVREAA